MSIILGSGKSRVIIAAEQVPGGRPEEIIDLPLTNQGGMIESNVPRFLEQEFISTDFTGKTITREQEIMGYDIYFRFDYSGWLLGPTAIMAQTIFRAAKSKRQLKLIPRIDNDDRFFEVLWACEPFDIGVGPGGNKARRNRLLTFTLKTKDTVPDPNWSIVTPVDTTIGGSVNLPHVGTLET